MSFIVERVNVHLNTRNKTAYVHLGTCPHGHHRKDSRGTWLPRLTRSEARKAIKESGYKSLRCSKCES